MSGKKLLTSPLFLLGLSLLLLNDLYLKSAYGNWFTGKLSDVAGLFIFPLFLAAFFPKRVRHCFIFTALFFTFWKLPVSDFFIAGINGWGIPIGRTTDPTDLLALGVLPLAFIYQKTERFAFRLHSIPVAVVCFFAFCATSRTKHIVAVADEKLSYDFEFPQNELIDALNQLSIQKLNSWNKDAEIQYSADGSLFYDANTGDTIVNFIDYSHLDKNDTIDYYAFPSRFVISGSSDNSVIRLLSIKPSEKIPYVKGGIPLEGVREFEKHVIKKLRH